jgi:DNA-binding MarR family transcriptional regulator
LLKQEYIETILLIERLHRRFLDVIKTELERLKVDDLNNVQTLILYNIGGEELTIGELTNRGYYLGSNVSYNVKKLVENGYLIQERSHHDKRSVKIKLSEKGLSICQKVDELYEKHTNELGDDGPDKHKLDATKDTLQLLERYWSNYINNLYKFV